MENRKRFIPIVIILWCLTACATTQQPTSFKSTAKNTLEMSLATYQTAMGTLSDLHQQKLITDAQARKAIEYGEDFWLAYQIACDALLLYYDTGDKSDFYKALAILSTALQKYIEYSVKIRGES